MILPEHINLELSEKYILSIRLKTNQFVFSISNPENAKHYCLKEVILSSGKDLLSNVQKVIFELNFLTQPFLRTNLVYVSPDYDLVPNEYFELKKKKDLYNLVHTDKNKYILADDNPKQACTTLYGMEEVVYDFLLRNLYNPQFFHHSTLLIDYLREKGTTYPFVSKMFVNFQNDQVDIISFNHFKLLHSLSFVDESPINQLYYILKVWEQSKFDQMNDCMYLIGDPNEVVKNGLYEFVKNIDCMGTPSDVFLWNEDAQKAPLDLLSLSL